MSDAAGTSLLKLQARYGPCLRSQTAYKVRCGIARLKDLPGAVVTIENGLRGSEEHDEDLNTVARQ
jgi:hypothetical protein